MPIYVCEEMQKLRKYLEENNIEYQDISESYMCRTIFVYKKKRISVINGLGSYGGVDIHTGENRGFLEVWGKPFGKNPVGHLTADNIIATLWK